MTQLSVVKRALIVSFVTIEICKLLHTPKQILTRGKMLGDRVFHILEHFCQTNECNEIVWLLLIALDKTRKR